MAEAQANARIFNNRPIHRTPGRSSPPSTAALEGNRAAVEPAASPFVGDTTYLHGPTSPTPTGSTPLRTRRQGAKAVAMRKAAMANKGCITKNFVDYGQCDVVSYQSI